MIDIKWGKQYSVGNEAIDRQHQVFIDLIRSTSAAIDSHRSKEFVRRGLEELTLYAKFHFFSEETLMINSNYPGYESHRQEHIELLSAFEEKIYEYMSKEKEADETLIVFIYEWFLFHTMNIDKRFTEYLNHESPA